MSIETAKLIYICDHIVDNIDSGFQINTIVRSSTDNFDFICPGDIISDIYSVYTTDNNGNNTYYYENYDFVKFTNDKIQWLDNGRQPDKGTPYSIEYIRAHRTIIQYTQENCTKCDGNGWYVDIVNKTGSTVSKVTGGDKIVQDFIQLLLTKNDDDTGDLFDYIGQGNYEDTQENILNYINECEKEYLDRQLAIMNSGVDMSDSELLQKVVITEIEFDNDLCAYFISLILVTRDSSTTTVSLKV